MTRLVGIICKPPLFQFASIVPIAEYREVFPKCKEHDPFLLTLRQVIMNMAVIAGRLSHSITLCFEKGPIDAAIFRVYESITKFEDWPFSRYLAGAKFDSKNLYSLQSADLVARESFKHVDNLGVRPMRAPVRRMKDTTYFVLWNKKALQYVRENGGPENLETLALWDSRTDTPRLGVHVYKPAK
jgi:hypothetical protein